MNLDSLKKFLSTKIINKDDYSFVLSFCQDNNIDFIDLIKDDFKSSTKLFSVALAEKDEPIARKIWQTSYKQEITSELLYLALRSTLGRTIVKEKSQDLLFSLIKQKKTLEFKKFIKENPQLISNISYFVSKSNRHFELKEINYFEKIGVVLDHSILSSLAIIDLYKTPEAFIKYHLEKSKIMSNDEISNVFYNLFSSLNNKPLGLKINNSFPLGDRFELLFQIHDFKITDKIFSSLNFHYDYTIKSDKLYETENTYYMNEENRDNIVYKNKINNFLNKKVSELDLSINHEINVFNISSFFSNLAYFDFNIENKFKLISLCLKSIHHRISSDIINTSFDKNQEYKYTRNNKDLTMFFNNPFFEQKTVLFTLNQLFNLDKTLFENKKIFMTLFIDKKEQEKIDLATKIFFENENLFLELEKSIVFTKVETQKITEAIIFQSVKNNNTISNKKLKI